MFSRFARVREADGSDMNVKDALLLINSTLDEVIGEQESDFDPDTRFAVKWYRQYGWAQENSGIADQLARSSDTSIGALERGGIFEAKGGKARLLSPVQMEGEWDAAADERVSVWEATVRLAAVMAKDGADKVAGAFRLLLGDGNVRGILVNIFGGIMRCDQLAEGIVEAARRVELALPLVVRLRGTNAEQGARILADSALAITPENDLKRAVETIVRLTGGAGR